MRHGSLDCSDSLGDPSSSQCSVPDSFISLRSVHGVHDQAPFLWIPTWGSQTAPKKIMETQVAATKVTKPSKCDRYANVRLQHKSSVSHQGQTYFAVDVVQATRTYERAFTNDLATNYVRDTPVSTYFRNISIIRPTCIAQNSKPSWWNRRTEQASFYFFLSASLRSKICLTIDAGRAFAIA